MQGIAEALSMVIIESEQRCTNDPARRYSRAGSLADITALGRLLENLYGPNSKKHYFL